MTVKLNAAYYEEQGREYARAGTAAASTRPLGPENPDSWQGKAFTRGYDAELQRQHHEKTFGGVRAVFGDLELPVVLADPPIVPDGYTAGPRGGLHKKQAKHSAHAADSKIPNTPVQTAGADMLKATDRTAHASTLIETLDRNYGPFVAQQARHTFHTLSSTGHAVSQHIDSLLEMALVDTDEKRCRRLRAKADTLARKWFQL